MADYVKIYKTSDNGQCLIETNTVDEAAFVSHLPMAILEALKETQGDEEYTLDWLLPAVIEIACKLRGYKTERVMEQRVLISGPAWPTGNIRQIGGGGRSPELPDLTPE